MISVGGKIGGFTFDKVGRRDWIRTSDLLLPKQECFPSEKTEKSIYLSEFTQHTTLKLLSSHTLISAHACSRMKRKEGIAGGKIGVLPEAFEQRCFDSISLSRNVVSSSIAHNFTFLKSPVSTSPEFGGSMAKRFTDTGKWAKASFSDLSLKMKLVWIYLCDNCDHAGVWDVNMSLLSFQLGQKTTMHEILEGLGDKIQVLSETKIFLPSFFQFQYADAKEGFKAKQSAIKTLMKFGIVDEHGEFIQKNSSEHLADTSELSKDCPSIGIGKSISNTKGGVGENKLPELARIWNENCDSLPKVLGTNDMRNRRIAERWKELSDADAWTKIIRRIASSNFCKGINEKGWKADFDWLLQPEVRLKVSEGKYDNKTASASGDVGNWDKVFGRSK